jgi:protein gp37
MSDLKLFRTILLSPGKGFNHRPMDERWVLDLRNQCVSSGTAFFFKQWGDCTPRPEGVS